MNNLKELQTGMEQICTKADLISDLIALAETYSIGFLRRQYEIALAEFSIDMLGYNNYPTMCNTRTSYRQALENKYQGVIK